MQNHFHMKKLHLDSRLNDAFSAIFKLDGKPVKGQKLQQKQFKKQKKRKGAKIN